MRRITGDERSWTKRDEIATRAMQGILATYSMNASFGLMKEQAASVAQLAYDIADAMLTERDME